MHIRSATLSDIRDIYALVFEHTRRGDVLPRSLEEIRETMADWLVTVENGEVLACVSLLPYTPTLAEVRSLAVHDRAKGQGLGSALIQAVIAAAHRRGIPTLFALTRAVTLFQHAGFVISETEFFPEKVWRDCHICPVREHCDETAVVLRLAARPHLVGTKKIRNDAL